jgi:CrcB protein
MSRFFWICVGGAAGTGARYLVSGWALALLGPAFPWGTLAVNVTGSFLLGGLMHLALTTRLLAPTLRLALTSGVLGGFTTYSTFNYETLQYLREGALAIGIANILLTVGSCLAAGVGGLALAQWWAGA